MNKSRKAKKTVQRTKKKAVPRVGQKKVRKKMANLNRIHAEMMKLVIDAVDKEVTKRFKIIIETSAEEDITKVAANTVLKDPKSVEVNSFHEALQPYIKHYLFMLKRSQRQK